jgi:hypothetical protein
MAQVIDTAGLTPASAPSQPVENPRRAAVRAIRLVLRKPDATDDELDDAYEALLELAKE